jgi:hypothetical protein
MSFPSRELRSSKLGASESSGGIEEDEEDRSDAWATTLLPGPGALAMVKIAALCWKKFRLPFPDEL